MGFFDVLCSATGVPLSGKTRLVLLAETKPGSNRWVAAALPIANSYNRLGSIDLPDRLDGHAKAIERFCAGLSWDRELDDGDLATSLSELGRGMNEDVWGRSGGRRVSYALFDDGVYVALAKLGAKKVKLTAHSDDLFEQVLPLADIREAIYGDLRKATLDKLRPSALDLARVLAFPIKLAPIDVTAGGQLTGYAKGLNKYGAAEPYVVKAKKTWAKHPEVLKAIAQNEQRWRELDDENDDDDDD